MFQYLVRCVTSSLSILAIFALMGDSIGELGDDRFLQRQSLKENVIQLLEFLGVSKMPRRW